MPFCVLMNDYTSKVFGGGRAIVRGKLPVPGCPANLDYSRARASALAVGAGVGCLDIFFSHLSFLFLFPLFGRRVDLD